MTTVVHFQNRCGVDGETLVCGVAFSTPLFAKYMRIFKRETFILKQGAFIRPHLSIIIPNHLMR